MLALDLIGLIQATLSQLPLQKFTSQGFVSPLLPFLFAWGWLHFLQHYESPGPIRPEPFCRLHFSCPLLYIVPILKCLCNNFGPTGVFWVLKILIRLEWVPISYPVENLVSSPSFHLISRRLTWVSQTPLAPTSCCWWVGAFYSAPVLIPFLYFSINAAVELWTFT